MSSIHFKIDRDRGSFRGVGNIVRLAKKKTVIIMFTQNDRHNKDDVLQRMGKYTKLFVAYLFAKFSVNVNKATQDSTCICSAIEANKYAHCSNRAVLHTLIFIIIIEEKKKKTISISEYWIKDK